MDLLTAELQKLGVISTPSVSKLAKLVYQHEQRKVQGKQRAQQTPLSVEQKASMLWARDHKKELDAEKLSLGAKYIERTKLVKGQAVNTFQIVLPSLQKNEYSSWLKSKQSADPNFAQYRQQVQNQKANATRLQDVIATLQSLNPPKYLSSDMKTYIRRMIARGDTDDTILTYIRDLGARLPQGILVGGKAPKGSRGPVPVPAGINAIVRRKK